MKRRNFLKASGAASLTLGGFGIKTYAKSPLLQMLAGRAASNDKVFVLINLGGGNDGLNTLIPLDQYSNLSKARSNVLIPDTKVLSLSGKTGTGFHPSMTGLQGLYNDGLVNAVQAVGYPSPNFSHFRSTDIWMTGSDTNENWNTGWMGRYLDGEFPGFPTGYPSTAMPDPLAIQIGSVVSLAFMGPTTTMGMAITDPTSFYNLVDGKVDSAPNSKYGKELTYIRLIAQQTNEYSTVIKAAANNGANQSTKYATNNNLAQQLKIVAKLIKGGLKTPVYMVNLGGFDTHSAQVDAADTTKGAHATLLGQLSDAIAAFQDDLTLMGIQDRVAGMTFSEFGRRIQSNFSIGTDHGAAAPLFVFGTGVQSGIIGANPTIPGTTTVNDNVPMQYDFRQVYASVFKDWFGLADAEVKAAMGGKDFTILPIFKGSSSGLEDWADQMSRIYLEDAWPNPAQGDVNFRFYTDGGNAELVLFDALGNKIRTIASGKNPLGDHTVSTNVTGLKPGNYFYQLSQGNKKVTKVLVVK
ncbi:MAG: DUF1501 domain-containing protein [Bacteroidetes bacterium]|nr:DUF1501 domain-containing protein [Bacteroidota bacterium]